MEGWKKFAAVFVIISSITLFIVVDMNYEFSWEIPSQDVPPQDFEWGISEGDEFILSCSAYGSIRSLPYTPQSVTLSAIADTSITVRVDTLPSCNISSEADFLNILSVCKVSTKFLNGTSIHENITSILNPLISRFIIPVGKWEYLDGLFPDSVEDAGQHEYGCSTYLSQLFSDSFMFGYRYFNVDAGNWWDGQVSLTDSVPLYIEIGSASCHPPFVDYSWTFRLDLFM
ncbi:MAG: hypothetical protein RTV72_01375 [Candidatus Thorarchaeota archaeon]